MLAKAFSKTGNRKAEKVNSQIELMKSGLAEALYISLKELRGDSDAYTLALNDLYSSLREGWYDFKGSNGEPVPRYKPYAEQHVILQTAIEGLKSLGDDLAFDLSMEGLKKLSARRKERKARWELFSRTNGLDNQPERPRVQYAGHLNDRGVYEFQDR